MKVPTIFIPRKNLDEKTKKITESFHTLKCLIEKEIEGYWKEREYCPDPLIIEYKHMKSVVECANVQYVLHFTNREVSLTIFKFDKPAKNCLEEIDKELEHGLYENFKNKLCLIKYEFVIIIKSLEDSEGVETFKKHYQEKFGFC